MNSPFKFLDSYTREDRDIFFGRDREIEEMYQKVFESKILLVYGISGTGKTSLIDCGLANKFEDSDWLPITVRRGVNITNSFIRELEKAAISAVNIDSGKGKILKAIQSIYLDHFKPIYFIFDQFEELFIFGDREEREEFVQLIKAIVESDVQCKFIFSIREEYLASITEFELTISDFLSNRMRVEKMTHQHAIQVIEGPCNVHGIRVEEKFPEALLDKLSPEGKEVELTYLQVFLDKIFKMSGEEEARFSLHLLDKAGDVSDLLGSFLEEQISELDDPETGLVVLKAFVSVKGTKRQITENEVVEFSKTLGKPIEKEELTGLIQRYVNLRILRDKDENNRYELRHDSLAAKIFEKITLVEKELLEVRQFIENAYHTYEKRQLLLTEKDLRYLKVYEDRLFLEGKLKDYVELSKKTIHHKQKQFKTILSISLVGFFLLLAGIGYYYYRIASESKNIRLASVALVQLDQVPELSFHSALDAYYDDTASSIAHFALLNSFYRLMDAGEHYDSATQLYNDPYKFIFDFSPCHAPIISAEFSKDGKLIYGWLEDNTVKVWNDHGKEVLDIEGTDRQMVTVRLSQDNEFLALVNNDSTGSVWNMNGEKIFEFQVALNPVYNRNVIDFSPDNRYLAVAGLNYEIILYDLSGNKIQDLKKHTGNINYLSFSPDNRFIASASDDKRVFIWNYNYNKRLFGLYDSITSHWYKARSCNFSKNSKYILTSADDSTINISRLNGEQVFYKWIGGPWWERIEHACNAEFCEDEKCILITRYKSSGSETTPDYKAGWLSYSQALLYDDYSGYMDNIYSNRSKLVRTVLDEFPWFDLVWTFSDSRSIAYDANNKMVSIGSAGKNKIILVSHDLLPLMQFNGNSPLFSPDGNYLIYINSNELAMIPVTSREVIRLVSEEKIFGEISPDPQDWFHIH